MIRFYESDNVPVGTKIVCANGHVICEVVSPLNLGEIFRSVNLGNYRPGHHVGGPGDQPSNCICATCGLNWFGHARYVTGGVWSGVLTEHGWWPKPRVPFKPHPTTPPELTER